MSMQKAVDDAALNPTPGGEHKPVLKMELAKPPVKDIGMIQFPMMVYKWPKEPFSIERRRNELAEIEKYLVPNEAAVKTVANADELESALKSGWRKQHYVLPTDEEIEQAVEDGALEEKPGKGKQTA